jgi:hypothetical protein
MVEHLVYELDRFVGETEADDDQTVLASDSIARRAERGPEGPPV